MIEWKEFRKDNQVTENLNSHEEFLILTGKEVNIAKYKYENLIGHQWWMRDGSLKLGVTHYAEINYPKTERGGLVNPDGGDYPLKWMAKE